MNTLKEEKLAKLLIDHSLRLESNEVLFFRFDTSAISLAEQIIKYASSKHINVITEVIDSRIESLQLKNNIIDESFIQLKKDIQLNVFNKMDAYLSIGANHNDFSLSDIDSNKLLNYRKVLRETLDVRLSKK